MARTRTFIGTFDQKLRRTPHPQCAGLTSDHYLTVTARNLKQAHNAMYQAFGDNWSFMYPATDYPPKDLAEHFPKGSYGTLDAETGALTHNPTNNRRNTMATRKTFTGKTRADVVEKARTFQRQTEAGTITDPTRQTLAHWAQFWVQNIATPKLKKTTALSYTGFLRKWVITTPIGTTQLAKLTPLHIDQLHTLMREAGKSETTINNVHRILSKCLTDAADRGLIGTNPCTKIKAPRPARFEPTVLTPANAANLITHLKTNEYWGASFIVALSLGLRQGERLGLCWDDIDFTAATMRVRRELTTLPWQHGCTHDGSPTCGAPRAGLCPTKYGGGPVMLPTKSAAGDRALVLPAPLVDILRTQQAHQQRWRAEEGPNWVGFTDSDGKSWDLVFSQRNGRPIGNKQDRKAWHQATAAAGVPMMRVHDARHTAATVLLSLGVAPRVVMSMMGWSNASMLSRYQHVLDEMRVDAATRVGGALFSDEAPASLPVADEVVRVDFRARRRG